MTTIKVFQGTRSVDAPRLCDSCSNGVVMRGPAESEEHVHCSVMDKPIRCASPSVIAMWIVRSPRCGR